MNTTTNANPKSTDAAAAETTSLTIERPVTCEVNRRPDEASAMNTGTVYCSGRSVDTGSNDFVRCMYHLCCDLGLELEVGRIRGMHEYFAG
jgi:hypothetical protein